jgi:PilZ domain-containing protein
MVEIPERRQVARLTVPRHLTESGLELGLVRLLDLSPDGARIEQSEPLHKGVVCYVDLPPALGRGRLIGKVVWTKLHTREQTFAGDRRAYYQSGLAFIRITFEQLGALAVALEILKTGESPGVSSKVPR